MITPIRNISFNIIKKQSKLNKNNKNKVGQTFLCINSSRLNFTGHSSFAPKVSFEYGVENNFFQLPKKTLEDGTQVQFQPDKEQLECAKHLSDGKNVVFEAPTGIGKTAVAHFIMTKNLAERKKSVYTVPTKALANDKYDEFCKIYGEQNVGILTGDRKINPNALIVIMTTEIFDNQAKTMTVSEAKKHGTVIFDEVHNITDKDRGMVWENSIVNAGLLGIQILALSATIGNSDEFTSWIDSVSSRETVKVSVSPDKRPVPLKYYLHAEDGVKGEKFYPIMLGEVDISQSLPDMSQTIINIIYNARQEGFERKSRNEQYKMGGAEQYSADENYKDEIKLRLEEVFGKNWITIDFSDEENREKLREKFNYLSGADIEQIDLAAKNGVKSLSDRQKRALNIIFELDKNSKTTVSDKDYEIAYNKLRKTIGPVKCDTEAFKEKIREKFPKLTKTQLDLIPELLSTPGVKNVQNIQKGVKQINYASFIRKLDKKDMLPAIIFKLSQRECEEAAEGLLQSQKDDEIEDGTGKSFGINNEPLDLLNENEKEQIRQIFNKYEEKGVYLGSDVQKEMLLRGYAVHHAGKLPQYKKLVEELFSKKLIKVVFATSTLGAGINMPAKTVVMSSVNYKRLDSKTKKLEETYVTSSEFKQMTGRAGRRGIDEVGYVVLYGLTPDEVVNNASTSETSLKTGDLRVAYVLMKSEPEPLVSSARPDPVSLVLNYYAKNKENQTRGLWDIVNTSFRVYTAKDKDKTGEQFYRELENYTQILLGMGYLIKDCATNNYVLTPKGKILSKSESLNPLLLSSLVCNEKLQNISALQLAQIAGHLQGASPKPDMSEFKELIAQKIDIAKIDNAKVDISIDDFVKARQIVQSVDNTIAERLLNKGVDSDDVVYSDTFAGMVTYLFACYNEAKPEDSIDNFEKISTDLDVDLSEFKNSNKEYVRRSTEGNIYKIIAGSISTLKQIIEICEFALKNEEDFSNVFYWENLKETAHEAIKLLNKEPINNDPNYANQSGKIN
ncbi:MAG: DEAD/DEAH box helicase [Candidatus Gastranaerophilales bacterium]|nr:DEAD/DEAH box helicase [Candidatus Gastranaerophilales bacterium]